MNSTIERAQVEMVQYGAAQKQFNIIHAVEFVYPVPPRDEQAQIATYLDKEKAQVNTLIAKAQAFIALLREHRTALMEAAVTGQSNVRGYVIYERT